MRDVAAMNALVPRPTRPRRNQKTRAGVPAGAELRIAFRQVSVSSKRVKRYLRLKNGPSDHIAIVVPWYWQ